MSGTFLDTLHSYSWEEISKKILSKTERDVEEALSTSGERSLEDFMALISPAAEPYIEEMARLSREITQRRFGKTIQLFAPLYLSNECQNICTYCGFSYDNKISRVTLSPEEIVREGKAVRALGFQHVLLVSGEANKTVGVQYFKEAIKLLSPIFSQISLEVQPLKQDEYEELVDVGLHSVLVYQETYHEARYRIHHPKGKKSNFRYRLDTPERLGRAGMHKIGIGALLGLEDWRVDTWFTALHLDYLRKKFWRTKYSVAFPRLRPAEGVDLRDTSLTSERHLLQLIAAYRLFDENVELSLSTRESAYFRDNAFSLGVTSMSAGSKTDPGGYEVRKKEEERALQQFSTSDERTPYEVATMIEAGGYEPVWKDWDQSFMYPVYEQEDEPYRRSA